MSAKNTTVSLTLQIRGNAGQELKKISDQQVQASTKINQQWVQIGSAQANFVNTAKAGVQATLSTARAGDQLLRSNRMLEGVLRQQSIQTKLQSQLLKQGAVHTQQMANWMKQVEQSSKRTNQNIQSSSSLWQKGNMASGATIAGGMIISNALQKPRDYDQQLTYIAATATGGQGMSTAERLNAKSQLNEYIKAAVRGGGGTRDEAAEAANTLIASGKYDLDTVSPALKAAVKTAFSTGASANDAASLTVRMQDFGITDLQKGHDIAVRGGQLGSFEYKDQAKWLAQQMAASQVIGYSGEKGLVELVALNQVAMKTAATTDEAGNNVVNLLAKLSSREFSKSISDAVQPEKDDPTKSDGKKKPSQVFDWSTYAIRQRDKGTYGVEAFVKLLERQLEGNKKYQQLQNQALKSNSPSLRKTAIEDMSNIAMGSEIGEIIADRQALMAALSAVYYKDDLSKIRNELPNASGTVNADSEMVRQTEWAKNIALDQEKLFAQSKAYDAVADSLGNFKDKLTDVATGNEALAASAYAASIALGAVAVGAGAATLLGGGKGGALTKGAGVIAGRAASFGGAGLAIAGAGAAGYGAGTLLNEGLIEGTAFGDKIGEIIGKTLAMLGNEDAKEAVEAQRKYEQMIAEQQQQTQYSRELINKINTLINVTQQNKPSINMGGSSLLGMITQNTAQEEKRYGAPPSYLLVK